MSDNQELRSSSKLKIWLAELRAPFFTASIIPVILGALIAFNTHGFFDWFYFLLTLVGMVFLHAGTNVANDYFDYKSGTDNINKEFIRPFSGGSRIIQSGLLSPKSVLTGALIFFLVGSMLGIYLALVRGLMILYIGLIGVISGFFYTAPPFRFAHKGIGELLVGLNFGTLVVIGSYYVQAQIIEIEPIVASLPISFLIAAVLWINEYPDYKADKEAGKWTLVVRIGREKATMFYKWLMYAPYLVVISFVLIGWLPIFALLILLTYPKARLATKIAKQFYNEPQKLVPANGLTLMVHLQTGILLIVAYLISFVNTFFWGNLFPSYLNLW